MGFFPKILKMVENRRTLNYYELVELANIFTRLSYMNDGLKFDIVYNKMLVKRTI